MPEVRVIGEDGNQIGVLRDRRGPADTPSQRDLDLVEVAPEARPPVCRVLDYSKYKYEQEQKAKAAEQAPEADQRPRDQVAARRSRTTTTPPRRATWPLPYAATTA